MTKPKLLDLFSAPILLDSEADDGDNLDHFWCCDPDVAYCGSDISDATERDFDEDAEDMCVVCYDMQFAICAKCGAA